MRAGDAIDTAWAWLRFQPKSQLARWYQRKLGKGNTRIQKIGIGAARNCRRVSGCAPGTAKRHTALRLNFLLFAAVAHSLLLR
jgi:hypothetical protein